MEKWLLDHLPTGIIKFLIFFWIRQQRQHQSWAYRIPYLYSCMSLNESYHAARSILTYIRYYKWQVTTRKLMTRIISIKKRFRFIGRDKYVWFVSWRVPPEIWIHIWTNSLETPDLTFWITYCRQIGINRYLFFSSTSIFFIELKN